MTEDLAGQVGIGLCAVGVRIRGQRVGIDWRSEFVRQEVELAHVCDNAQVRVDWGNKRARLPRRTDQCE